MSVDGNLNHLRNKVEGEVVRFGESVRPGMATYQ
jgi:hypothetical protein